MAALVCEICGGRLVAKAGGLFECEYCGMQYDKTRIQEMVQEIKGTVRVEGTVEVSGTVKVEGSAASENLLHRGFQQLEDMQWDKAAESLNQVLSIKPENGRAYLGLAMAERKLRTLDAIEVLARRRDELRLMLLLRNNNYKRAKTYADRELSERMALWETTAQEINAQRAAYEEAKRAAETAARKEEEAMAATVKSARDTAAAVKKLFAVGFHHVLAVQPDGTVLAAGTNGGDQIRVSHMEDVAAVCTDDRHSIGLRTDGTAVATPFTGSPEDYADRCEVQQWKDLSGICTFFSGTFGITKKGQVLVAGKPFCHDEDSMVFEGVRRWTDITQLAAGTGHAIGLKRDGTVVADIHYRHEKPMFMSLVVERKPEEMAACRVDKWQDIVAVSAGSAHSVGLRANGTVAAAGSNAMGECDVSHWDHIVDIAAGNTFTAGLKADGTVLMTDGPEKTKQLDWTDIVAIHASYTNLVGLRADGTLISNDEAFNGMIGKWKLFDSIASLHEEQAVARKRLAERREAEIRQKREKLENEKKGLEQEAANLTGLFKFLRRSAIQERLSEIETELEGLK